MEETGRNGDQRRHQQVSYRPSIYHPSCRVAPSSWKRCRLPSAGSQVRICEAYTEVNIDGLGSSVSQYLTPNLLEIFVFDELDEEAAEGLRALRSLRPSLRC